MSDKPYRIVCDETNNTPEDQAKGILRMDIAVEMPDDLFWHYAMEPEHDEATLARYVAAHPAQAHDLRELHAKLNEPPEPEQDLTADDYRLIDRALAIMGRKPRRMTDDEYMDEFERAYPTNESQFDRPLRPVVTVTTTAEGRFGTPVVHYVKDHLTVTVDGKPVDPSAHVRMVPMPVPSAPEARNRKQRRAAAAKARRR